MSESNLLPMIGFTKEKQLSCLYSLLFKNTLITEMLGKNLKYVLAEVIVWG